MAAAAGSANPPYNWVPAALPVIPLPDNVFLQELGHANKSDLDYGDERVAWYNLGLEGVTLTSEAQFLQYARALVQRVRDPLGTRDERAAREHRAHGAADDAGLPAALDEPARPPPAPGARRHPRPAASGAPARPPEGPDPRQVLARRQAPYPSGIEGAMAQVRHFTEAETARRFGGFTMTDGQGQVHRLLCTHAAFRGEGNSLWHALAAQVRGARVTGEVNLYGGRAEKAIVFDRLQWVLGLPSNRRHLMYFQMQAISPDELRQRYDAAAARRMWEDWGEMSLLRCLAVNDPDAGPPKDPQFKGVFQLISDVWHVEVLVWVGVIGSWSWSGGGDYELHVFGQHSYGLHGRFPSRDPAWNQGFNRDTSNPGTRGAQNGGRGQLVFVTDPTWTHYSLPANVGFPFDTSHKTNADRYGWLGLPFLNQNGPMGLNAWIAPPWTPAPAPGPWRTFADMWIDFHSNAQTDSYLADFDARDCWPLAGTLAVSRMPAMPNAATRAGWNHDIDPNQGPLPVENWSMTSGCYRDPNRAPGENSIKWGRFENKSAYEIHRLKAKLELQNFPWEPRSTTAVDDEIHLQ